MKYLKTFESQKVDVPVERVEPDKFNTGDYVVAIDSFINNDPDNRIYEIEHVVGKIYDVRPNIHTHTWSYIVDYSIYNSSETYHRLFQWQLRKAAPQEIQDYEMKEKQIKYNL